VTVGMLDVLNAPAGANEEPGQSSFPIYERTAPEIVAIERQQIKRAGDGELIGGAAVQGIELWNSFFI
jgi:hypothetical protein